MLRSNLGTEANGSKGAFNIVKVIIYDQWLQLPRLLRVVEFELDYYHEPFLIEKLLSATAYC